LGRAGRQNPRLSVHPPIREIDAKASFSAREALGSLVCATFAFDVERSCPSRSPTLQPWITVGLIDATVSYVEERWSPALSVTFGRKCTCNHTPEISGAITERHWRTFLSWAGPQMELEFFKLSITF
jgi:hypothetical protein